MSSERRVHERVPVSLGASWMAGREEHSSRVTDLCLGGCFVKTVAKVFVGEPVYVNIRVPGTGPLLLSGEVAHEQWPLGFGLRFTGVGEEEYRALGELVRGRRRTSH